MTGAEHYIEAEKHLEASTWQMQKAGELDTSTKAARQHYTAVLDHAFWEMQMAGVHAKLALVVATEGCQPESMP